MSRGLPVWSTTWAIIAYCWQERRFALKYAWLPVVVLILVDMAGIAMGIDIAKNWKWLAVTNIVSLLAYTPFIVTWYQKIIGLDAQPRGLFTFHALEWRVVMANVQVGLILGVALLLLIIVVALIGYGVFTLIPSTIDVILIRAIIMLLSLPAIVFWLVLLTRLSLVVAYAAAGEHISISTAWKLTRGIGFPMTWIDILLAVMSFMPVGLITFALTAAVPDGTPIHHAAVSICGTLGGVVYLTLFTTLYGLVYRRLKDRAAQL